MYTTARFVHRQSETFTFNFDRHISINFSVDFDGRAALFFTKQELEYSNFTRIAEIPLRLYAKTS